MNTSAMNTGEFEAQLRRDGYLDIETKAAAPNSRNELHSHDYDVRVLVLEGEATIDCGGAPQTYRPGDVLEVQAGVPHTEQFGPAGYRYIVGRRHKRG